MFDKFGIAVQSALGYLNLPAWTSVFAFGRFYSNSNFLSGWGYSALVQGAEHQLYEDMFCVSTLRDMGGIFKFQSSGDLKYNSHGVVGVFQFPPLEKIFEGKVSDCPATPNFIGNDIGFSKQKCFCIDFDDITVWLPKLELAGQMFFFDKTLIRSAFTPGALDFNFCLVEREDTIEINALPDVGICSWAFDQTYYRRRLGWLLTNKDVRDSFCSIWLRMNQERTFVSGDGYVWDFNFSPPASLLGSKMTVIGTLSEDKRHMLVWEITKIEVSVKYDKKLVFIHPNLKEPCPVGDNPLDSLKSLSNPTDSIMFLGDMNTSVSYYPNG